MSWKGYRYEYHLKTAGSAKEIDMVGNAYQAAGWIEVEIYPDKGPVKVIVFEWLNNSPPCHPIL